MNDDIRRLLDLHELQQLKARYFRCLDTKQWEDWGQVFAADAVMELPEVDQVVEGRVAIVASVSEALSGTRTVHHGHMPELALTGADTANGIWAMFDYVEWPPNGDQRSGLTGYGHYHEEYVRNDGRWWIKRIRLERLRVDPLGR